MTNTCVLVALVAASDATSPEPVAAVAFAVGRALANLEAELSELARVPEEEAGETVEAESSKAAKEAAAEVKTESEPGAGEAASGAPGGPEPAGPLVAESTESICGGLPRKHDGQATLDQIMAGEPEEEGLAARQHCEEAPVLVASTETIPGELPPSPDIRMGWLPALLVPSWGEDVIPLDATPGEATLLTTFHLERPMPKKLRALGAQGDLFAVSTTDASTAPATGEILRYSADESPCEVLTGTRFARRADTARVSGT